MNMSKVAEDRKYSKDHEWVTIENGIATVGISDHAQDELGEIVYVELPQIGDSFESGDEIAEVESVKAASPILTPVGGEVCEVNEALDDQPELLNEDCYGTWIYKLKDVTVPDDLLDAAAYGAFIS